MSATRPPLNSAERAATYVPSTADVRDQYQGSVEEYGTRDGLALDAEEAGAAFDRWLAEHDAALLARASTYLRAERMSAAAITLDMGRARIVTGEGS